MIITKNDTDSMIEKKVTERMLKGNILEKVDDLMNSTCTCFKIPDAHNEIGLAIDDGKKVRYFNVQFNYCPDLTEDSE